MRRHLITRYLPGGVLLVASTALLLAQLPQRSALETSSQVQVPGRTVVTFYRRRTADQWPVSITGVTVNGQPASLERPVVVSGQWLRTVHVLLRNDSPRTIIAGSITLVLPETGDGTAAHPAISDGMQLGRVPADAFRQKDGTLIPVPPELAKQEPLFIPPGGTMDFHDALYPAGGLAARDREQAVASRLADHLSRVAISPRNFYFSDGAKWTGSVYLQHADPPAAWRTMSVGEFFAAAPSIHP